MIYSNIIIKPYNLQKAVEKSKSANVSYVPMRRRWTLEAHWDLNLYSKFSLLITYTSHLWNAEKGISKQVKKYPQDL